MIIKPWLEITRCRVVPFAPSPIVQRRLPKQQLDFLESLNLAEKYTVRMRAIYQSPSQMSRNYCDALPPLPHFFFMYPNKDC